ncbi:MULTISPECIES: molybdopterin-dependent oxidoreductase [unclassified Variovorax]|jgi:biotin/methionine sulfoxide reductase|uniref:molybdopterin-dependent oxidoreductase n=1 Tax=unclassified Variovorax TaxID=663243 RepID=UPI000F7F69C0|nr:MULTISPECIES: molybdopterin-dependent oxidoreductase [unclassified Variovorax]RSZ44309.1 Asp-tRNA(Asn)/Glu-tRNA(Gln) amidotransferase GatCAB subunit C [Variovorax sp. 553]RSZ45034.1 Asp-tRNA(Asn)/Glu-tRNA(Gln) amidotransferase GatCAB subunit C [Variovorax sp. 679]
MLPVQENRVVSTHWGTYSVSVNQGRVSGIRSWSGDPAPAPVWEGLDGSHTGPRVAAPAVRQSFLEKQHRASGAGRGREPFVEVDWKTALDMAAAQLDRVRATHGNTAIFGGSYGWASAGRFNHAQSQIHRFLNLLGGYTRSINSYSYGAGEVIIPRVVGSMHSLAGRHTSFKSMIGHTRLLVTFGGLPEKNAQVNAGGVTRHRYRDTLGQLAQAGVRLVSISPIRDDTSVPCEWVPIRPQTDVALMLGLAYVLETENLANRSFLARYTVGYDQFRAYLLGLSDGIAKTPQWASSICRVPAQEIAQLARDMARHRTMITMSWSVQRAENGEQPYWMTVVLASMIGQIGLEGGGFGFGYAAVNGIGLESITVKIPALPQGRNPVSSFIPVARIADMLLNKGQSFRYNGQTLTYPDTRLIYWAGGNPFHHHQDLNRLRKAWAVPETIIVNEPWWTATAKHADIVFPTTVAYERNDIVGTSSDPFVIASAAHAKPHADARNDYEVFSELATRLGCLEEFTGGKTEEDWLRSFYAQIKEQGDEQGLKLPTFDEFWAKGMVEVPTQESAAVFSEFIHDPVGKPLRTPSGRIELFSQTIRDFGIEGQPGHPVWIEPQEWLGATQAQAFPLHLLSNQPSSKLHSQYDHAPHSRKLKISEREPIRIHPVDAASRNIETGMIVRVFNTRGSCLAGAVVSDAVIPGVLQMATGAWLDLSPEDGDGISLDKHGNANVLTRDFGTSEIAQGSTANSCLVEIERFAGVPPATTCFDPPAIIPKT